MKFKAKTIFYLSSLILFVVLVLSYHSYGFILYKRSQQNRITQVADSLRKNQHILAALKLYKKALKEENTDEKQSLNLRNKIAICYLQTGQQKEGFEILQKIFSEEKNKSNYNGMLIALGNLGVSNSIHGEHSRAMSYFKLYEQILRNKRSEIDLSPEDIAPIYNSKGSIYQKSNEIDSALYYYQKALSMETNQLFKGRIIHNIAQCYFQKQDYHTTDSILSQYITIARTSKNKDDILYSLNSLANSQIKQRNIQIAAPLLDSLKPLVDSSEMLSNKKRWLKANIELQNVIGDKKKSLFYQTKLDSINQLIKSQNASKHIFELYAFSQPEDKNYIYLILVAAIIGVIMITFYAFQLNKNKQKKTLAEKAIEIEVDEKEKTDNFWDQNKELKYNLIGKLDKIIDQPSIICDPKMNLNLLARKLNSNPKYISSIINDHYKVNFKTFLNEHKIQHAAKLLKKVEYSHYTIEAIGNEAGFSNKTTFNNAFKRYLGQTPSEYRDNT